MLGQSVSLWSKIKTDIKTAVSRLFDKRRVLTTGDGVVTVEDDQGNIATIPQLRGSLVQPGDDVLVLRALNSEIVLGPISTPGVAADAGVPPHEHTGPATFSTRLGTGAEASYPNATALGARAKANHSAVAVGNDAMADYIGTVVVGQFSGARDEYAIAIGQFAFADGKRSWAIGQGAYTDVDDRGVLRANEVLIMRSDGLPGETRIGLRDSSGNVHWIGVTNSNITFDGNPVSGGGGPVAWDDITNKPSTFPPSSHQHNASAIIAGTLDEARIPNLAISKITNLQTSLDDKVSKSAGGTQNITGSLQLSGSIGATGGIINGGIFNGDNDNAWPWGALYINSPIISDVYGAPQWDGDTGLGISHINGLQTALNGKADTSHTHAAGDITSGTFADARIPNLNASKITAGTFAPARLGSGTAAKNTVLHGDGTWKQLQIGVPFWGSQQWYGPITNGSPWKAETNLNGFPNNHFATWFVPPHDASVDRASIYVVTAGGAGSVARIAIYADNNGEPGARVADFGSVLTDSTGTKTTSAISAVNLTGGTRYWAVVATSGTPVLNGMTAWASLWGSTVNGSALCGITAIRANTNMPTNWSNGDTTFNHQISPRVVFRTT